MGRTIEDSVHPPSQAKNAGRAMRLDGEDKSFRLTAERGCVCRSAERGTGGCPFGGTAPSSRSPWNLPYERCSGHGVINHE